MEGPGEGDSALEPHEKRRIAERGKTAADIGYEEDEEDDNMSRFLSPLVGTNSRTNHDHSRTGSTDPAG